MLSCCSAVARWKWVFWAPIPSGVGASLRGLAGEMDCTVCCCAISASSDACSSIPGTPVWGRRCRGPRVRQVQGGAVRAPGGVGPGGYRSGLEMHGPCSLVLLPGTLGVSSARWSLSPLPWQRQRQHLYVRENLGLNIDDCSPGSCLHPPV